MKEWGLAIEGGLLLGCVWALLAICLGVVVVNMLRGWRVWRKQRHAAVLTALACAALIVGGAKKGSVIVNDPYIRDDGSYVTNDFAHIAIVARYDFIPADTEVLVYTRTLQESNATDWVQWQGDFTIADFPQDLHLENATNYNWMVAANYIPEPTVHTNGVWRIKGFLIPESGGKVAFPNTRTTTIGD